MNKKEIKITLTLMGKDETFTSQVNQNQMSATGLRISTNILYGNGAISPTAQIRVYGLHMDKMLKLLRVRWNTMQALMNTVKIESGNEGQELDIVYEGNITFAYPDMGGAPDIALIIESQSAIVESLKPAEAYEVPDPMDAADAIAEICEHMGYDFERNDVVRILDTSTYEGTNLKKIQDICDACEFDLYIEQNLIAITERGGTRNIKVPVIAPDTGLIGYPTPDLKGVKFKCFYDPVLRFGGLVNIEGSEIDVCNGHWRIYGLTTTLDANMPGGHWQCEVNATWADSKDAAIKK